MLRNALITAVALALLTGPALAQTPEQSHATNVVVATQQADQWLASKFIGMDVIGTDNGKIGDVKDVLFEQSGKVVAYVIGIGEFLGIGTKNVALAPSAFEIQKATDNVNMRLRLATTKDELKSMTEFKPFNPPATIGRGAGDNRPTDSR